MRRIVTAVQSLYQHATHFLRGFQDGILGGKRVNGGDVPDFFDGPGQAVIHPDGLFLRNIGFHGLTVGDAYMSPEAEYLATDRFLETIDKRKGDDHDRHADDGSGYGQPYDEAGK